MKAEQDPRSNIQTGRLISPRGGEQFVLATGERESAGGGKEDEKEEDLFGKDGDWLEEEVEDQKGEGEEGKLSGWAGQTCEQIVSPAPLKHFRFIVK